MFSNLTQALSSIPNLQILGIFFISVVAGVLYFLYKSKSKKLQKTQEEKEKLIHINNTFHKSRERLKEYRKLLKEYQKQINKINKVIFIFFFLSSCATERIVYETKFIKPDLIKLDKVNSGSCQERVKKYDAMIDIYQNWYQSYQDLDPQ